MMLHVPSSPLCIVLHSPFFRPRHSTHWLMYSPLGPLIMGILQLGSRRKDS